MLLQGWPDQLLLVSQHLRCDATAICLVSGLPGHDCIELLGRIDGLTAWLVALLVASHVCIGVACVGVLARE